jgi:hypothetical protein
VTYSHNNSGWGSTEVRRHRRRIAERTDRGKRLALLFEAEKILLERSPHDSTAARCAQSLDDQPGVSGIRPPLLGADLDSVYATVEK